MPPASTVGSTKLDVTQQQKAGCSSHRSPLWRPDTSQSSSLRTKPFSHFPKQEQSIPSLKFLGHTVARITAFIGLTFPSGFQTDGSGFIPHNRSVQDPLRVSRLSTGPTCAAVLDLCYVPDASMEHIPGNKAKLRLELKGTKPPRKTSLPQPWQPLLRFHALCWEAENLPVTCHAVAAPRVLIRSHKRPIKSSVSLDYSSQCVSGLWELHLPLCVGRCNVVSLVAVGDSAAQAG